MPTFQLSTDLDIELQTDKVKKLAGALGKLLKSEEIQEAVENAKEFIPTGKAGIKVAFKPDYFNVYCPGTEKRFAFISYSLKLGIVLAVAGQYGIVKGKANVAIEIEIASDFHECECGDEGEGGSVIEVITSDDVLLANGPTFARPDSSKEPSGAPSETVPERPPVQSKPPSETLEHRPPPEPIEHHPPETIARRPNEAIVMSTDEQTGEVRVLKRFLIEA